MDTRQQLPADLFGVIIYYCDYQSILGLIEYLVSIDLQINWEYAFSERFNIDVLDNYASIKKVLSNNLGLLKYLDWKRLYLYYSMRLEDTVIYDNAYEDEIIIMYHSYIYNIFPNAYFLLNHPKLTKVNTADLLPSLYTLMLNLGSNPKSIYYSFFVKGKLDRKVDWSSRDSEYEIHSLDDVQRHVLRSILRVDPNFYDKWYRILK